MSSDQYKSPSYVPPRVSDDPVVRRAECQGKTFDHLLTVWEGSMPESNGKSNYTAILCRRTANDILGDLSDGFTIARSEYPDRVRYEADCVRWLIGEIDGEKPCILNYDADNHSGYVKPAPAFDEEAERVKFEAAVPIPPGVYFDKGTYYTTSRHFDCIRYRGEFQGWLACAKSRAEGK